MHKTEVSTLGKCLGTEANQSSMDRGQVCPRSVCDRVQRHWLRAWTGKAHRATGCCVAARCATEERRHCAATGCCVDWSAAATALLPSTEETGSQQRSADRGLGGFIWGVHARHHVGYRDRGVERGQGGYIWGVSTLGRWLGTGTGRSSVDRRGRCAHARYMFGCRGTGSERGHARRTEPLAAVSLAAAPQAAAPPAAAPQAAALTGAPLLRPSCRAQRKQGHNSGVPTGDRAVSSGVSVAFWV